MDRIVLFANAWGPRRGGINSFNGDLCAGLAQVVGNDTEIVCVLLGPAAEDASLVDTWTKEADSQDVRLAFLALPSERSVPIQQTLDDLRARDIAGGLYIGHDTFTGAWAIELGKAVGAPSLVINHMAPFLYKPFKGHRGDDIWPETQDQDALFRGATYVAGVGPRLNEHARSRLPDAERTKVFEILPGMPNLEPGTPPRKSLNGITIGRISPDDDVLKRGRLAASAFGATIRDIKQQHLGYDFTFQAIGLSVAEHSYRDESDSLDAELKAQAGIAIAFHGHRFNEDRRRIYDALRQHDVFYMLSLHEGFGLSGLEAIAAGTPLILSARSGLYDYLSEQKLDGYVTAVSLSGDDYWHRDLEQVVEKTKEVLLHRAAARSNALRLRGELYQRGVDWRNSARQLLVGCGCERYLRKAPAAVLQRVETRKSWPWRGLGDEEEAAIRALLAWSLTRSQRFAYLTGPLSRRKARIVARFVDIIRWDLGSLYRTRVERILAGPRESITERMSALWKDRSIDTARGSSPLLLALDLPTDGEQDPSFWSSLFHGALAADTDVLLTTPPPLQDLPAGSALAISWPPDPEEGGDTTGLRFAPEVADAQPEAIRLLSQTALGLSSDEIFELLDGFDEDQRYRVISSLESSPLVTASEGRWKPRLSISDSPPRDPKLSSRLASFLEPALEGALAAVAAEDWSTLRPLLPSALEAIVQRSRAGQPDRAFVQFRTALLDPTMYRYGRFDFVVAVLETFFEDPELRLPRFSDSMLGPLAQQGAAQAMANLGFVRRAMQLLEPLSGSPTTSSALLKAAFCAFLAGSYEATERWLLQSLNSAVASGAARAAIAVAHRSLGKLYIRELRLDDAARELDTAHAEYTRSDDEQGLAGVEAYQAELSLARGLPDAALAHANAGLERLVRMNEATATRWDTRDRLRLLLARGRALLRRGLTSSVQETVNAAMTNAIQTGAQDLLIEAHVLSAALVVDSAEAEAREHVLVALATRAETTGLRRHQAELVLAQARLRKLSRRSGANELVQRARTLADLDGGVHRDASLQSQADETLNDDAAPA